MEEVCLNSEPVFNEDDEFEVEEEGTLVTHSDEIWETQFKDAPRPTIAYGFYNCHAKEQGFGIRVSNSWFRSKRKEHYKAKLSCSSAGFKKETEANHPRPETRTACLAMIVIRFVDSERWRILVLKSTILKVTQEYDSCSQKSTRASTYYGSIYNQVVSKCCCYGQSNGCSNFDERERESILLITLSTWSSEKEMHKLSINTSMKLTNPNFFYLMDLDDEGRLRNVFWADPRSRDAYRYFSDTVAIDATSLSNKFELPLVLFVGVNHHGQAVLLGCGFIGQETVEHFRLYWTGNSKAFCLDFRSWLTCMHWLPPQIIITDQCNQFLPRSSSLFLLVVYHTKSSRKVGRIAGYEAIKKQLCKAVYESQKIAEFETSWYEMIKCHGLGDNKWLQMLYEVRQTWVPVYLEDISFAGMIPIKENEMLNAFFGHVHKHTSFKELVGKYDLALQRKHLKEAMADLESKTTTLELKTRCNFELQLSMIYTKEIFKKFQCEVEGMYSWFNTRQVNVNGLIITYKGRIEADGSEEEVKYFEVLYETSQVDSRCICSLFNFKGYLCRHALNVLNYNRVEEIPARNTLPRWSKDFKCRFPLDHALHNVDVNSPMYWYDTLYKHAIRVVEEGTQSEEHYKLALQRVQELLKFSPLEDDLMQLYYRRFTSM
ncbi:LOW QUALITY PROTEIN: MULE transposase domain [Dillenia turbinata]|uniref:Protein FAR1-RELATED SEQUENCE n=1 Tax=Dillenia turbinata TaxID=194707 RepID=A0AAN8YTZ7_9MAGN